MSLWRPRIAENARMKYLGIVEALEADVRSGRIRVGDRLPPQRMIADALGVDLTTVTRAFNEARRRGLVDARAGRGTFVRGADTRDWQPGRLAGAPLVDLSMNVPPQPSAVDLQKEITAGIGHVLAGPRSLAHLQYQTSTGGVRDRLAAAAWLAPRLGAVSPDRLLVVSGAQSALYAICETLLRAGNVIATGMVTYPGLKSVIGQKGLVTAPVAMDTGGIVPEAFEEVCRARAPVVLYVVPSIDSPTTATLSEERRQRIADIARKHKIAIIEDDPYAPLRKLTLPAFARLASDITWHVATLSKCATPSLRIAHVVAPSEMDAQRLARAIRTTTLMASPLLAALATRWIREGTLTEIVAAIRTENAERQHMAAAIIGEENFAADPDGHHLWLHMPSHWRAAAFADHAERSGVAVVPGSTFSVTPDPVEAVRVSLGTAPDRDVLKDGLSLLAGLMAQPSLTTKAIV
ncbi:PLP-dependent aminotransferase family protein [Sphingomonas sp. H39-1-10]|uniref:aminotransferase-like domain-containing protein n=1 Tax=Sphingomonas pollutisoli TaxID=3030829 RepID=UPI0023B894AA|nr:PLP-dependent aminotransferase family protein [Sphingomonas pollutisoli]MDF0490094.1 PLP-dependent aminotransferase family protein [Sphingomonas pollutisoli]